MSPANRPICKDAPVISAITVTEIETPSGVARAHVSSASGRRRHGLAVLGHGAGGGIEAADLVAVTDALTTAGWEVARVEQPYRVKGRRAPEAAPRLDAAWLAVVAALRGRTRDALVVGGRSSGARVACRTAAEVGAAAVVALSFPLHPPGKPEKTRVDELASVIVPVLVIQGDRDPFGNEAELRSALGRDPGSPPVIVSVPGDHSLRNSTDKAAQEVIGWITGMGL
jgi:predicted alpha/beta-hydrolase family hydrolase